MHLLLVDDDPDIRLLAGFVIEAAGHRITFAGSGRAGIDAAHDVFDAVLLDYRLGDMTGSDVLPVLLEAAPARPVVFLTGNDDPDEAAALVAAGAAGVITKPFDPERLVGQIERIVAHARDS